MEICIEKEQQYYLKHMGKNEACAFVFPSKRLRDRNIRYSLWDFPGGAVVKNPPADAGDVGLIPGLGRSHMPQSN